MRRRFMRAVVPAALWLLAGACASEILYGSDTNADAHLTAVIDGASFSAFVPSTGCIGVQVAAAAFVVDVNDLSSGADIPANLTFSLRGITGPTEVWIDPDHGVTAGYIPARSFGSENGGAVAQYSAPP